MDLGVIGLGRMGGNMAWRLTRAGHRAVGWARHEETVRAAAADGIVGAASIEDLVAQLAPPRAVSVRVRTAMRRQFGGHREAPRGGGER
jgi:6-phosphogluconate dehydrogenase